MDEDISCPRCGVTKLRKPSLRLLVNVCGHSLCETCIDLLFARGSGACPTCGTALRRQNFKLQFFEDSLVQREVDIRRQILRDYNKRESDFPSLAEYNDYLELVETIVYNLANNVDVDATRARVHRYQQENREQIRRAAGKLSCEQEEVERRVEAAAERRRLLVEEELSEREGKRRRQTDLIQDLLTSSLPADHILARHQAKLAEMAADGQAPPPPATTFSTGVRIGGSMAAAGVGVVDVKPYRHERLIVNENIPQLWHFPAPAMAEWVAAVRAELPEAYVAGGFQPQYVVHRALQAFYDGLYNSRAHPTTDNTPGSEMLTKMPDSRLFQTNVELYSQCNYDLEPIQPSSGFSNDDILRMMGWSR